MENGLETEHSDMTKGNHTLHRRLQKFFALISHSPPAPEAKAKNSFSNWSGHFDVIAPQPVQFTCSVRIVAAKDYVNHSLNSLEKPTG
jgi:hypothetical protein